MVGVKTVCLWMLLFTCLNVDAEVDCSRSYDLGNNQKQMVIGDCWYVINESYYRVSDLSDFTWVGGYDGAFLLNATDINSPFSIKIKPYFRINNNIYTPLEIHNYYPDYDMQSLIETGDNHKFGLNITQVPQIIQDNIQQVIFQLDDAEGIGWDDVELLGGGQIGLKDLVLDYNDLREEGYTINLYNKTTLLIGNVSGKETLFLDPTIEITGDVIMDNYMSTYDPTTNYGTLTTFVSGQYASGGARRYRPLISFVTPSEDLGTIDEVILSLYCGDTQGYSVYNRNHVIYQLTKGFNETGSTWQKNDSATAWDVYGGDFDNTEIDRVTFWADCGSAPKYYNFTLLGVGATNSMTIGWDTYYPLEMIDLNENYSAAGDWAYDQWHSKQGTNKPKVYFSYTEVSGDCWDGLTDAGDFNLDDGSTCIITEDLTDAGGDIFVSEDSQLIADGVDILLALGGKLRYSIVDTVEANIRYINGGRWRIMIV